MTPPETPDLDQLTPVGELNPTTTPPRTRERFRVSPPVEDGFGSAFVADPPDDVPDTYEEFRAKLDADFADFRLWVDRLRVARASAAEVEASDRMIDKEEK